VPQTASAQPPSATVLEIGQALMLRYSFPLELIGLLLTAALVGATILAMSNSFESDATKGRGE
jgi:NADH-quinone oxidoreductase subunit J